MAKVTLSENCDFAGRRFLHQIWSDGNDIYSMKGLANFHIERVVGEKSRRKSWCIVDRSEPDKHDQSLYPPKFHQKSFKKIEEAVAVFMLLEGAGLFKGCGDGN